MAMVYIMNEFRFKMPHKQNTICIIIPYFGKWPKWIDYFLTSCIQNQNIDWLFFTDCGTPKLHSRNLTFIDYSLSDFNNLAREKLDLDIHIKNPYKLCDFKPAYGYLFSDYLGSYDFWGYGDLDLVYGNTGSFLTGDVLENFDIISHHNNFITGHFCILRNTPEITHLFKQGNTYQKIFAKNAYWGFDEIITGLPVSTMPIVTEISKKMKVAHHLFLSKLVQIERMKGVLKWLRPVHQAKRKNMNDFTSIVFSSMDDSHIRVHLKKTYLCDLSLRKNRIKNWKIRWNNGILTDHTKTQEILYFHFQLSKCKNTFEVEDMDQSKTTFYIGEDGFKMGVQ